MNNPITYEQFCSCTKESKFIVNECNYFPPASERQYRIFRCLQEFNLKGPTLDVASGSADFFPVIRRFKSEMLPYSVAEMFQQNISCDGEVIPCVQFQCEKDLLPIEDNSIGVILFCDVIEHLIVDPVWTILEFNRVLRTGGHLIISTPNAASVSRALNILVGGNPASENHYKPTSIYQRHNREWTLNELNNLLLNCGFDNCFASTHGLIGETEHQFLKIVRDNGLITAEDKDLGTEIYFMGQKKTHKTLNSNLSKDERWPDWLYTHFDNYRRRPEVFPIVIGKDYA